MKIALDWALPAACFAVIIGLPLLWRPPRAKAPAGPDKLDALIQATRELPHESYAWGAPARERMATAGDEPVPCLPAEADDLRKWGTEMEGHWL